MPPFRAGILAGIFFLAAFAGPLPAQILVPTDFSSPGSFTSIADISMDTDAQSPKETATFSDWAHVGGNGQGLEEAPEKIGTFPFPASSDSPLEFLRRLGPDENSTMPQTDLAPIPEPAAVVMVIVAGMLTIFRRRSRLT